MALPPDPEELIRAFEPQSSAGRTWEQNVKQSPYLRRFRQRYGDDLHVSEAVEEINQLSGDYFTYFDDSVQALDYLRSEKSKDYRTQNAGAGFAAIAGTGGSGATSNRAAPITDIPTTTSNPERPRTVAAGWESYLHRGVSKGTDDIGVLTVVFRDGTYYNYYDVARGEWYSFRQYRSKGEYIKTFLDSKRRSDASVDTPAQAVADIIYRIARTSQGIRGGGAKPGKHSPASYEVRKRLKQFYKAAPKGKGRYVAQPGYGRGSGRYVTSSKPIRQGQTPNK